jgi:signal transduction histidine kinase
MADASHQLRTPLSIARTAADVTLSKGERATDEYRDALTVIAEQTQRLTRIVDDMFALALADADARPLRLQRLYLEDLIEGSVRAARVLAEGNAVTLHTQIDRDCQLMADEELLRQLMLNLLENAARHSPRGGRVEILATCDDQVLRLRVRDSGPGVPEAEWERVFERFVRLDSVIGEGGGGLGLPIARWIAELHGGTLGIASSSKNGTTFEALLPILAEPA